MASVLMIDFLQHLQPARPAFLESHLPLPRRQGKVRDVYDLGQQLLIVSSDRISAFDYILPNGIPDKGKVLTAMSNFWFQHLQVPHHLIANSIPADLAAKLKLSEEQLAELNGRTMLVRKTQVVPFECVVRGYLEGSGWKEYQSTGSICGIPLPAGLKQCDRLPEPIFTPATKAETGHDENVSFEVMAAAVGQSVAEELRAKTLEVFRRGSAWAESRGIIIADTKLEWGVWNDQLILIDEVLTPDSSRFWPLDQYEPGHSQPSFDKQYVREWLMASGWDRNSPPPELPADVIENTRQRYIEAYRLLAVESGKSF